jgi:hypothetical protein
MQISDSNNYIKSSENKEVSINNSAAAASAATSGINLVVLPVIGSACTASMMLQYTSTAILSIGQYSALQISSTVKEEEALPSRNDAQVMDKESLSSTALKVDYVSKFKNFDCGIMDPYSE